MRHADPANLLSANAVKSGPMTSGRFPETPCQSAHPATLDFWSFAPLGASEWIELCVHSQNGARREDECSL
jgi:hypothetical protein